MFETTAEDIAIELMENAPEEPVTTPDVPVRDNPYVGIASAPFSPEAAEILMAPLPIEDIEIRPDGLIYLPEIKYRRILNKAFGPGAWSLLPMDITVNSNDNMLYYRGALFVHGRFVSEAIGDQQYFASNDRMSFATAAESAKSSCLTRCCKDLGIASELWDPSFVRVWIEAYAVEVWTENVGNKPEDKGKKRRMWRKRESPAINIFPWVETPPQSTAQQGTAVAKADDRKVFRPAQAPVTANSAIVSIRQAKRFRAIAAEFGWTLNQVGNFLRGQGYNDPESILRKEYDRICAALEDNEIRASYRQKVTDNRQLLAVNSQAA